MDNQDVTDTHYDKNSDLLRRLDAQYDRIDEVEETVHAGDWEGLYFILG